MKKTMLFTVCGLIMTSCFATEKHVYSQIKNLHDGDSFALHGSGSERRVRLYGIDAPEAMQQCQNAKRQCYPCGQHAKKYLHSLTYNQNIRCDTHRKDQYGRALATCYQNKRDLGLLMIQAGWAIAYYRDYLDAENRKYLFAEMKARMRKIGIWQGDFEKPYTWRRQKRNSMCPVLDRRGNRKR